MGAAMGLIGKNPGVGKDWRQEEKGTMEDKMVGWYHWLNGHEFEQTPGDGERQGSMACYSPQDHKESKWLSNWTELNWREFSPDRETKSYLYWGKILRCKGCKIKDSIEKLDSSGRQDKVWDSD